MSDQLSPENIIAFDTLDLHPDVLKGVKEAGFRAASPIQAQAIPVVLEGGDLIAQAHTGTGKTAAFGLPAMSRIDPKGGVGLLVIAPTRELTMQVSEELYRLGQFAGLHTCAIYGGQSSRRQVDSVARGAQIVVATPGRLLDLLQSGRLPKFSPSIVVLDEADEMLDMGFLEDIQAIFSFLPESRQTLLFSATMPPPIRKLADRILKDPQHISVKTRETTNINIDQHYYVIEEYEREDALTRLIEAEEAVKTIVFCRTKLEVERLATSLSAKGLPAFGLHGDIEQSNREKIIRAFRGGAAEILVATDVAARGLDVSDVSHVFNYHVSFNPESYVHRIGRTGRAGKKGKAITLVTPHELREIQKIQHKTGKEMTQSLVPTRAEMRRQQAGKLIEQIRRQPLNDEAAKLLLALEDEMDFAQLALKLISMQLEQENIAGPENIGLRGDKLRHALDRLKNRRDGGKRKGPGGRPGNGFRSGHKRRFDSPERRDRSDRPERKGPGKPSGEAYPGDRRGGEARPVKKAGGKARDGDRFSGDKFSGDKRKSGPKATHRKGGPKKPRK